MLEGVEVDLAGWRGHCSGLHNRRTVRTRGRCPRLRVSPSPAPRYPRRSRQQRRALRWSVRRCCRMPVRHHRKRCSKSRMRQSEREACGGQGKCDNSFELHWDLLRLMIYFFIIFGNVHRHLPHPTVLCHYFIDSAAKSLHSFGISAHMSI